MQNAPPKSLSATQGHGSLEWSIFYVFAKGSRRMAEERRRRSTFVGPGGDDMHRGKSVMEDGSI